MSRDVAAVLLAGGRARRMGGSDKCLLPLGGRPILAHIIERVRPQASALVLNANGELTRFAAFGLPVVPDAIEGFAGPLAGVLTGMIWARTNAPGAAWLVSIATDTPFVPRDLVTRLKTAATRAGKPLACAASGGQSHPVIGLWSLALEGHLRAALVEEGVRKVDAFTARHGIATVDFPTTPIDPFFNVNTPDDLAGAERIATLA